MNDEKPVTEWYTLDDGGHLVYNHLEDGHHYDRGVPLAKTHAQAKAWQGKRWAYERTWLTADHVVVRTSGQINK